MISVTFLGTGTSIISPNVNQPARDSTSLLVEVGHVTILLDCGWSSLIRAREGTLNLVELDQIVITHSHADHIGGLMPLIHGMFVGNIYYPQLQRNKDLRIGGYPGLIHDWDLLRNMMFPERVEQFKIEVSETDTWTCESEAELIAIHTTAVPHSNHFAAIAVRIEVDGLSLVYGGDCGMNDALVQLAASADLLICEAGRTPADFISRGPSGNHLAPQEAAQIAERAGASQLALVHRNNLASDVQLIDAIKGVYSGKLILPHDLDQIEIV